MTITIDPEQHDNHCIVSALGDNWRITSVSPSGRFMFVRCDFGCCERVLDTVATDWELYQLTALEMMAQRYGTP